MDEGEAKVAAVHGSEGARAAQVRRDGVLPLDDLAADNPSVLRYGSVLTGWIPCRFPGPGPTIDFGSFRPPSKRLEF